MSTTIYNGFRCGTRDQREAMLRIDRLGPRLRAIAERREQAFVTAEAVRIVDQRALALALGRPVPVLEPHASPWDTALARLRERQAEVRRTQKRDPEIDTEVVITLWKTDTNGEWLGFVGADGSAAAYQYVIGQTRRGLSAYAYWDNTDHRPPGVTLRAWKQREKAWRGTRRRYPDEVPTLRWTFEATTDPAPSRAQEHLPTLEQRANPLTEPLVLSAWLAQQPPLSESADYQAHLERYLDFRDRLKNDPVMKAGWTTQKAWVIERLEQNPETLSSALVAVWADV